MWHLRGVFVPDTYFSVVWLVYVAVFFYLKWMCEAMWGLCVEYITSALGHTCLIWQA